MSDHPTGDPAQPPYGSPQDPPDTTPPDDSPAPAYPTYPMSPPQPAYPAYPAYPPYAGAPSMPLAPADPNLPPGAFGAAAPPSMPAPSYPPYPAPGYAGPPTQPGAAPYPGYQSYPSYPTAPGYPSSPTAYPGYPTYPGYPGYPPAPGVPVTVPLYGQAAPATVPLMPDAPSRWNPATWLKGPLPVAMVVILVVVALLAVAGGAATGVGAGLGDWASGGIAAGYVALVLAALALFVMGLRIGFGRRARSFYAFGVTSIVILAALGGSGLALLPTPLHRAQAQSFESNQLWSDAITQYRLAGEQPPGSHDLARVYDEWGDDLLAHQRYSDASQQYETVINTYPNATTEVQRAHDGNAKALYALGQQALTTNECQLALIDYQTLAQQYSDTPDGTTAKAALAAPVVVSGQIGNYPAGSGAVAVLSSRLTGSVATGYTGNFDQSNFSQDYTAAPDASGNFTFTAVAQGKYNLELMAPNGYLYYWYYYGPYNPYSILVGPLCPVNVGTYVNGGGF